MADVQQSRANSVNGGAKRKQSVDASNEPPALLKRMKTESAAPPEANPNTMEAVKERNRAMELELCEKNRRIAYLMSKCEALYRGRAVADTSFRCVRRQWLQLHDDLAAVLQTTTASDSASDAATTPSLDARDDSDWRDVFTVAECFGLLRMPAAELQLNLPEWFLAIGKDDASAAAGAGASENTGASSASGAAAATKTDDHEGRHDDSTSTTAFIAPADLTAAETQLHEQLVRHHANTQTLVATLLRAVAAKQPATATNEFKALVAAKRAAVAQALALKDQVQVYHARIEELERDVQAKEVERHRACREFDRLSHFVERNASTFVDPVTVATADTVKTEPASHSSSNNNSNATAASDAAGDVKPASAAAAVAITAEELAAKDKTLATLRENQTILSTKLYTERAHASELKKELERFRALEIAWKREDAAVKQEYEDKLEHLREEKQQLSDEFNKIRHKAKDVETHVHEKWKKKLARLQSDMTKVKSHMDELSLKNVALREKLSSASGVKEQLNELKSTHQVLASENDALKAQLARAQQQHERSEKLAASLELAALTEKVALLESSKRELQTAYDALKQSETANASDKLASMLARQSELDTALEHELAAHTHTKTALASVRLELEALQASEAAAREENDALISEIETMSSELAATRQTRRKLLQQVDEKRNSTKKLHTQLAKEEQAKAHCFEELAATRLQVSSLTAVHRQQKTMIDAAREALALKEKELEALTAHVDALRSERDAAEADKRRVARDADVAKQLYTTSAAETSQRLLQEQRRACDKCDAYKKKEQQYEKQLQAAAARAAGGGGGATGELTDLERFELKELQKLVNCSVCQDQRKNVLIAKCFHMFCRECVDSNLKSRNRKCPTCKKMFGQDDVKAVWFT